MLLRRRAVLAAVVGLGCSGPRFRLVSSPRDRPGSLPLVFTDRLPTVPIAVGGKTVEVMFDLGGEGTISLRPDLMEALGSPTGRVRSIRNVRGDRLQCREFILPEVRIADIVLADVRGYERCYAKDFAPPITSGSIGRGVLARLRMIIDYPAARVALSTAPLEGLGDVPVVSMSDGPVVRGSIGNRDVDLLLDTGATASLLRPSVGVSGPLDVRLGKAVLRGIDFRVFAFAQPDVDGFLGANFFEGRRVLIDFPGKRVALPEG
jgi:hypothetical protein